MGSKINPGPYNCMSAAHRSEPVFTLLGRDELASPLVRLWASIRAGDSDAMRQVASSLPFLMIRFRRKANDAAKAAEALQCADDMEHWFEAGGPLMVLNKTGRQSQILDWVRDKFGAGGVMPRERAARFLEEAVEAAQAAGLPKDEAGRIVGRVFERPAGDVAQEIGGAGMTLEALAESLGVERETATNAEWCRVQTLDDDDLNARHAAKAAAGIAVPAGE